MAGGTVNSVLQSCQDVADQACMAAYNVKRNDQQHCTAEQRPHRGWFTRSSTRLHIYIVEREDRRTREHQFTRMGEILGPN